MRWPFGYLLARGWLGWRGNKTASLALSPLHSRLFARNRFTLMATPRCASRLSELLKQSIYTQIRPHGRYFFSLHLSSLFFLFISPATFLRWDAFHSDPQSYSSVPGDCDGNALQQRDRRRSWKDVSFVSRLSCGFLNDARKYYLSRVRLAMRVK